MSRAASAKGSSPQRAATGSPSGVNGNPRTPRGSQLRDRINFFEQVLSDGGRRSSGTEDFLGANTQKSLFETPQQRRSSSRASDSSFEESFERLVEEGELNGAKVVKFEKIIVKKTVREVSSDRLMSGIQQYAVNEFTESNRTPSEERAFEDSAYQSHSHGTHSHGSKSSSVMSFTKFPSDECLSQRRCSSSPRWQLERDDRSPSEWYADYRNQSFQNVTARMDYVHGKNEYDAHIAEIKGITGVVRIKN